MKNIVFLSLVAFPIAYYVFRDGLAKPAGGSVEPWEFVQFSIANIVPGGIDPGLVAVALVPQLLVGAEAVIGVVAVALFATYIFRWSLHR